MGKKEIETDTKTRKEMLDEMFISADKYLERALPEMKTLADDFYQFNDDGIWDRLLQMLEGIQWIMDFMTHVINNNDLYSNGYNFAEITTALHSQLVNLEEALKVHDTTLIGDIIYYEVIPSLKSGKVNIQNAIDKEVIRHDLN